MLNVTILSADTYNERVILCAYRPVLGFTPNKLAHRTDTNNYKNTEHCAFTAPVEQLIFIHVIAVS